VKLTCPGVQEQATCTQNPCVVLVHLHPGSSVQTAGMLAAAEWAPAARQAASRAISAAAATRGGIFSCGGGRASGALGGPGRPPPASSGAGRGRWPHLLGAHSTFVTGRRRTRRTIRRLSLRERRQSQPHALVSKHN